MRAKIVRYQESRLRTGHALRRAEVGRLAMNLLVGVALTIVSTGTAHALSYAYVAAGGSNTVEKIFLANNTIVDTITVGSGPTGVCQSANELFVYVPNFTSGTVSVISTVTDTVMATITVGSQPHSCAVSPDGSEVWVTNADANTVSVIATATNTVSTTTTVGGGPRRIVVLPTGTHVYVSNFSGNTISVLNATTAAVVATITVGGKPWELDVTGDGSTLYVANFGSNSVQKIATATNTVTATLTVDRAAGLSLTPDNTKLYVGTGPDGVSIIDTVTFTVETGPITVGSQPDSLAITPDGTTVYVANFDANSVSVISTTTNAVTATITGINGVFFTARLFGPRLPNVGGIPTLPEWGVILLTLSLLAIATWQLAAVPAMATGVSPVNGGRPRSIS